MTPNPRQSDLLEEVRARGSVSVEALAERFGVTLQTVRRDVKLLSDEGLLARFHGGVRVPSSTTENIAYRQRQKLNEGAKQRIVPLSGPAHDALSAWLGRDGGRCRWLTDVAASVPLDSESAALFHNRRGRRLGPRDVRRLLDRRSPVPTHPHALRHTFATHLLDGTVQTALPDKTLTALSDFYATVRQGKEEIFIRGEKLTDDNNLTPILEKAVAGFDRRRYLNLSELLARAWTGNAQRTQAWIKWDWLAELNGGLIALSGADGGVVGMALLSGDTARARAAACGLPRAPGGRAKHNRPAGPAARARAQGCGEGRLASCGAGF